MRYAPKSPGGRKRKVKPERVHDLLVPVLENPALEPVQNFFRRKVCTL